MQNGLKIYTTCPLSDTLLFLLPPSCIVVPIGIIANKIISPSTFSSTITFNNQHSTLPTVHLLNSMGMDKSTGTIPVNSIKTRGRTP